MIEEVEGELAAFEGLDEGVDRDSSPFEAAVESCSPNIAFAECAVCGAKQHAGIDESGYVLEVDPRLFATSGVVIRLRGENLARVAPSVKRRRPHRCMGPGPTWSSADAMGVPPGSRVRSRNDAK